MHEVWHGTHCPLVVGDRTGERHESVGAAFRGFLEPFFVVKGALDDGHLRVLGDFCGHFGGSARV